MKYIIDIPNEMVIKSALNGLTLGIAMIETSTQKQFIVPTNIPLMPYIEPQKWIPCSERLPYAEYGESDNVFATCGYRDVEDESIRWLRTLYFNGGNWCYPTGETYLEKVYAWMPLPDPWKEEE